MQIYRLHIVLIGIVVQVVSARKPILLVIIFDRVHQGRAGHHLATTKIEFHDPTQEASCTVQCADTPAGQSNTIPNQAIVCSVRRAVIEPIKLQACFLPISLNGAVAAIETRLDFENP